MTSETRNNDSTESILAMAADIVSAYVSHNALPAAQIPELIQTVYRSLAETGSVEEKSAEKEPRKPPMPIRQTIKPDYLVCLEDGKRLKLLKRHLRTNYDMSPEEYRMKWGLPSDYPMVAPNYARQRSEFAKKIGLGRKRAAPAPEPAAD